MTEILDESKANQPAPLRPASSQWPVLEPFIGKHGSSHVKTDPTGADESIIQAIRDWRYWDFHIVTARTVDPIPETFRVSWLGARFHFRCGGLRQRRIISTPPRALVAALGI
jgi:hypothetical protein